MENLSFNDFESRTIETDESSVFIRRAGKGPPLLLLHGFPETHRMWHRVAPLLTRDFTVVCADLRGYGASGKPASSPDHAPYSKSALALDLVQMMEAQGFARFSVAGHDRGGRVAYRLALDHDELVERAAVLDIVTTSDAFDHADARFALSFWPWALLAQPEPLPERLIASNAEWVVEHALSSWGSDPSHFPPEVRAAYIEALRNPESVHAICEEFRAAASLDRERDAQARAFGQRIQCPLLVLWSSGGALDHSYAELGGPLALWRRWAHDVRGHAISGGHFFPEQNPVDTANALRAFFSQRSDSVPCL